MADLTGLSGIAVRLYRKYRGDIHDSEDEILTLLTGNKAVVIAEAAICESAVLGGDGILEKSWHEQVEKNGSNLFKQPLTSITTKGARAAVASAIGLALAGKRATTFVTGQNIGATQDLLFTASGRHLPLVIHLTNNAMSGHGIAPGSGHEGYHLSCDSGVFTLFAQNAQQAADFTFIARRVAETTLIPGLVAMDSAETALSLQDVNILGSSQVKRFLAESSSELPVPNEAQRMLFGDTRLTVPRWHDVDRPVITGAAFDSDSYAMGAAGKNVYFEDALVAVLEQTFTEFYKITGRQYGRLTQHRLERAETVFVAEGAAVETAIAVADSLPNTGVIGVACMRPFPAQELGSLLEAKSSIVVLERLLPAPGAETPLLREIRRSLSSSNALVHSVRYGIGGEPLRAVDLALVPSSVSKEKPATLHLGMDFAADTLHPKRQVLQDQLKRAYPNVAETGLRSKDGASKVDADGTISLAVLRSGATGHAQITQDVATILHQINAGSVRSRPWLSQGAWGERGADFLIHSNGDLVDPGDHAALDIACLTRDSHGKVIPVDADTLQRLRPGGKLIVPGIPAEQLAQLLAPFSALIAEKSLQLFSAPVPDSMAQSDIEEITLGAVLGTIVQSALATLKERKIFSIRNEALQSLTEEARENRLELFKCGFENVSPLDVGSLPSIPSDKPDVSHGSAPSALQHLAAKDNQFDSVPRFWDQVGIVYQSDSAERLSPDPYLASGTIAPLSATFRDFSAQRSRFPKIDADKCTGCGKCWTACPDSAIAPVAISPADLIDHGIRVTGGDSLRQLANQLSSRIMSQARKQNLAANVGIVLRDAYDWLSGKLDLAPERQEAVEDALDLVCDGIGALPVSVTAVLFEQAEAKAKGSGELLSLVINPDSCKDCGLCEAICEDEAISFEIQDEATLISARQAWNAWMTTPDTSSDTIDRVVNSDDVDNMAALNLSRHCLLSMSGGDGGEAGSGEKIAMRMALAATEFQQQPIITAFSNEIAKVIDEIRGEIRKVVSLDLSDEDLNQLEKSVDGIQAPLIELSALAKNVEANIDISPVDTARLGSLLDITSRLTNLQHQLTSGRQGLGRSRFGLAIANGNITTWAAVFPYNAFQSPVTVDFSNETAPMAAGLLEGHLRDTCESIALLRLARIEIDSPPGAEFAKAEVAGLTWQDLSEEERQICPPMLIVGDDETLGGVGMAQVLWSLNSDLPIKIISFTDLDLGLQRKADRPQDTRTNTGLLAVACRSAYVAQTSIAHPDHYQRSIEDAIKYSGPAFIRVHTPSPKRHGFNSRLTLEQARLAVQSRAFPLFSYNPDLPGVHGTRLDISANDVTTEAEEAPFTVAHWAATEERFSGHFKSAVDDEAIDLTEYIGLTERARKGKSAFITIESGDESIKKGVDGDLIKATEAATDAWQVLQELSGVVTPFTAAVEETVRQQLKTEHDAEIATIRAEYEQQLKDLSDNIRSEVAGTVRSQLVRLVGNAPARSEPVD